VKAVDEGSEGGETSVKVGMGSGEVSTGREGNERGKGSTGGEEEGLGLIGKVEDNGWLG
jgi:hypothetical protein